MPPTQPTRAKLLKATAHVMRERGLTGTTIREIAREAGVAEGALYRHFPDKVELIRAVVLEEWPSLGVALARLLGRIGKRTVRENLEALVVDALRGYREQLPFTASIANDAQVLAALREEFAARHIGPARAHDAVVMYLGAEAERGRVELTMAPVITSAALLGACHERAFLEMFHKDIPFGEDEAAFARDLVRALVPGAR